MGAIDRASFTVVIMEDNENRSPIDRLAQWMAIEVSDHSKLTFSNNAGNLLYSQLQLISHEL